MSERQIVVAAQAGFCRGVKRAVGMALEALRNPGCALCSLGPLIHNPSVIADLEGRGLKVLPAVPSPEELAALAPDTALLIRAHGITARQRRELEAGGHPLLDGTCPHVIAIQRIVERAAAQGRQVLILGDRGHAEVMGLLSFAPEGEIISTPEEAEAFASDRPLSVVCQSTLDSAAFKAISGIILRKHPAAEIHNTRCDATEKRQDEAQALCGSCDAMVVIGGQNSANSNRLAEICRRSGRPTFFVTEPASFDPAPLGAFLRIGVTAGASTPQSDIDLVVARLESL